MKGDGNEIVLPGRRKPLCAGLGLAVPMLGLLLTFGLLRVRGFGAGGDFSAFAPSIAVCLVALPLGLIGLSLAIAAIVRREKWIPAAILGVVLNLAVLGVFLVFVLDL
jgi:hypothetical protein